MADDTRQHETTPVVGQVVGQVVGRGKALREREPYGLSTTKAFTPLA
jgi:hypothetical protein